MGHIPMTHGVDPNPASSKYAAKAAGMMGITAEVLAKMHGITREQQDKFALQSHQRAAAARAGGRFKDEFVPLEGHDENGFSVVYDYDEVIREDTTMEGLTALKPVFDPKNCTVTAGNSSAISDGASALLVMSKDRARSLGLQPMAQVRAIATAGVHPSIMGMGPVDAVHKALRKAELSLEQIKLFELNEAFAVQSLAVVSQLKAPADRVNIRGGAIALPPGRSSGTAIDQALI